MVSINGKALILLSLLTVAAAALSSGRVLQNCTSYEMRKHNKNVTACLCTGELFAASVDVYIGKQKCATITLANCTLDQMVSQMDKVQMYEVHYHIDNCHIKRWQPDYMMGTGNTPSQIQFLEFRNVTLGNKVGWFAWTTSFNGAGKLYDMLRLDNSADLVMNAGPLFSEITNINYELALTFANMNLSDSSLHNQVISMLFVFNKAPKELGEEEKSAFLNTLIFESTQLVSIPKLLISVQPLNALTSTLSFRGNRIREVDSTAFETYKVAGLLSLDLSNNEIEVLHQSALSNFTSLRELNLSYNRLEKLDFSTFSQLEKLAYLNLRNNRLTVVYLPPGIVMSLPTSQTPGGVLLGNNPWNCTCTLYPLINIFRDMSSKQNASVAAAYQEVPMCSSGINFNQVQGSSSCPVSLLAPPTTTSTTTRTRTTTTTIRRTSTTTASTSTSTSFPTTTNASRSSSNSTRFLTTASSNSSSTTNMNMLAVVSDTKAVGETTTVGKFNSTFRAVYVPFTGDDSLTPTKPVTINMTIVWILIVSIFVASVVIAVLIQALVRRHKRMETEVFQRRLVICF